MDAKDSEVFEKLVTLEIHSITDLLTKIFEYFTDHKYLQNHLDKTRHDHIDVSMEPKHDHYSLEITNFNGCVANIEHFLRFVFSTFILKANVTSDVFFAMIYHRNEYPGSMLRYIIEINGQTMTAMKSNRNRDNCYLKKFTTVILKADLLNDNLKIMDKFVIDRMKRLQNIHTHTKFTYNREGRLIHDNRVRFDDHFKMCEATVEAITDIVKLSFNNEFRSQCHGILNVDNTCDMKRSLMKNLLSAIHKNYLFVGEIA